MSAPRLVLPDEHHPHRNGLYPDSEFKRRHAYSVMDVGGSFVIGLLLGAVVLVALALGVGAAWIIYYLVRGWH